MKRPRRYVKLEAQGHVFRVRRAGQTHHGGGVRGKVRGMSAGSRRRLLEKLARLDITRVHPLFITLTYADIWPDDNGARQDLENLFKRLERRYPKVSWIWRLEHQDRGAPHLHMIVLGVPYLPVERLRRLWSAVIAYSGQQRLQVDVQAIRSWKGVMFYAAKYIAKLPEGAGGAAPVQLDNLTYLPVDSETFGRVWGIMGAERLPWATLIVYARPVGQWFYQLKYLAGQQWAPAGDGAEGFMLYVDDPGAWLDLARTLDQAGSP